MIVAEVRKFDKVIMGSTGAQTILTPEEFKKIPLGDRVKLICQGQIKFYKNDVEVPATEALKSART